VRKETLKEGERKDKKSMKKRKRHTEGEISLKNDFFLRSEAF
jgi:hypothetical protein